MPWWSWMLFGAALFVVEMLLPGSFFMLFFGVGAVAVGTLVGLGLITEPWLEWLLFSAVSVASLLVFRRGLLTRFQKGDASSVGTEGFTGDTAVLLDDLEIGAVGRAELRGSVWNARSRDDVRLARGTRCRVESVDGLTLWVRSPS